MSIKRFLKSLAAAAMTAAIVTVMSTAAFAATDTGRDSTLTVSKTITSETYDKAPNAEFSYAVTAAQGHDATAISQKVYDGVMDAISVGSNGKITFTTADALTAEKTLAITADASKYPQPGIYRYTLTETAPTVDGLTDDTKNSYDFDVYVVNGTSGYQIDAIIPVGQESATSGKSEAAFEATYTTTDLVLSKTVTGNQGDTQKDFSFTVEITADASNAGATLKTTKGTTTGTITVPSTVGQKVSTTVTLKHGESFKIEGLVNDAYSITETDYSADGYTTTISNNGTSITDSLTARGTVEATEVKVAYTNDKTVVPPTGIILTYAPYILLVAGAAVFAVVFFRRRRNAED